MSIQDEKFVVSEFKIDNGRLVAAGVASAAALSVVLVQPPAQAADEGATAIIGVATGMAGVAAACLVVALAPLGIAYAFKIGKRVMSA